MNKVKKRALNFYRNIGAQVIALTRAFRLACQLSRYTPFNKDKLEFSEKEDEYYDKREDAFHDYWIIKQILWQKD